MEDNRIWEAKGFGILENGKTGWYTFKTFEDFAEADDWLCFFVKKHGYYYGDFKISKRA